MDTVFSGLIFLGGWVKIASDNNCVQTDWFSQYFDPHIILCRWVRPGGCFWEGGSKKVKEKSIHISIMTTINIIMPFFMVVTSPPGPPGLSPPSQPLHLYPSSEITKNCLLLMFGIVLLFLCFSVSSGFVLSTFVSPFHCLSADVTSSKFLFILIFLCLLVSHNAKIISSWIGLTYLHCESFCHPFPYPLDIFKAFSSKLLGSALLSPWSLSSCEVLCHL